MSKQLVKDLKVVKKRFRSLEKMAEALRPYPGFEGIDRSTLSRWETKPSKRAALAVSLLNNLKFGSQLRLAQPRTLAVLPSIILNWNAKPGRPYHVPQTRYGVEVLLQETSTGGEAFQRLASNQADVALGADTLYAEFSRESGDYKQLCVLSSSRIAGLSIREKVDRDNLSGKVFAYPLRSAMGDALKDKEKWGLSYLGLEPDPRVMVKAFKDRAIHGLVAWETLIEQVKRQAKKDKLTEPLVSTGDFFGEYTVVVAVNTRTADPSAVLGYFLSLQESAQYVTKRKDSVAFHRELLRLLPPELRPADVSNLKSSLKTARFEVKDLNPETLLMLWTKSEVRLSESRRSEA